MNRVTELHNPYQPPRSESVGEFELANIGFRFSVLCALIVAMAVAGYGLVGTAANGYEMAREFSDGRLRAEIGLMTLLVTGLVLCFLLSRAVQFRSIRRVVYVLLLAIPGLAYIGNDLL